MITSPLLKKKPLVTPSRYPLIGEGLLQEAGLDDPTSQDDAVDQTPPASAPRLLGALDAPASTSVSAFRTTPTKSLTHVPTPTILRAQSHNPNYWRRQAQLAAKRYHINPHFFSNQMGVESVGFDPDVISGARNSPAGAQGIAQIMPSTASGWGVNPLHPMEALDAAAKHMAEYLHQYGGSWAKALTAYNAGPGRVGQSLLPETRTYIDKILNGQGDVVQHGTPSVHGTPSNGHHTFTPVQYTPSHAPATLSSILSGLNKSEDESSARLYQMLDHIGQPGMGFGSFSDALNKANEQTASMVNSIGSERRSTPTVGQIFSPTAANQPQSYDSGPVKPGKAQFQPGTRTGVNHAVISFLNQMAGLGPVVGTTGKQGHSQYVSGTNRVSDHYGGNAMDLGSVANGFQIGGRGGDRLAAHAIQIATGMSSKQALALAHGGGIHNFTPTSGPWKGYRIQIIWKAPDHYDHVHVGVAPI